MDNRTIPSIRPYCFELSRFFFFFFFFFAKSRTFFLNVTPRCVFNAFISSKLSSTPLLQTRSLIFIFDLHSALAGHHKIATTKLPTSLRGNAHVLQSISITVHQISLGIKLSIRTRKVRLHDQQHQLEHQRAFQPLVRPRICYRANASAVFLITFRASGETSLSSSLTRPALSHLLNWINSLFLHCATDPRLLAKAHVPIRARNNANPVLQVFAPLR
jgi:hypothetical protein